MSETQDKPWPVQIKVEPDETKPVWIKGGKDLHSNEKQLVLKQEAGTFMSPNYEQKDEPQSTKKRPSANSPEAESQHQQGSNQKNSGLSNDKELKPEKRPQDNRKNTDNVDSSEALVHETNLLSCEVCGKHFTKCRCLTVNRRELETQRSRMEKLNNSVKSLKTFSEEIISGET
ncbi:hypothetical protein ATANTOWER_004199 [Ataeniobius toweri]|uniref:Uncharacterized protein n=1 Tax=Ataeniobius toweri TaxID=208326 RepID=A0ABU7BE96_9TELE|nr:hypothetical protein [Ataeniobius toweri]